MAHSVIVLGSGIVGASIALHLQKRGADVVMLDRGDPHLRASFGNGGIIQTEAVLPYPFPRDLQTVLRMSLNQAIEMNYNLLGLLQNADRLRQYWWHSASRRYRHAVLGEAPLIRAALDEHKYLADLAGCPEFIRPTGWLRSFGSQQELDAATRTAREIQQEFGVDFAVLDLDGLARAEPSLQVSRPGAILWKEACSLGDPGGLVQAYLDAFTKRGGKLVRGDARTLTQLDRGWQVQVEEGIFKAEYAVVALGSASVDVTRKFGYRPPLFGKRGYHVHYKLADGAVLNRPLLDTESGFLLAPMKRGIRLTTGAQIARSNGQAHPVQLARAEPIARRLLPIVERLDPEPWMGVRPCMPDMLPVIGEVKRQPGLWCAFGHGHQGLTLGPVTGRLVAEAITGEKPFLDLAPYRPGRY